MLNIHIALLLRPADDGALLFEGGNALPLLRNASNVAPVDFSLVPHLYLPYVGE